MKICIDPGHGGSDPGAVHASGRTEKTDNLKYALELDQQFRARGLKTVLTRETDVTMPLTARTALENKEGCALALSCHRNGSNSPTAAGFEIWLHSRAPDSYVRWGNAICARMAALGFKNRGVHRGHVQGATIDYAVNRDTISPSMLIELGFVTSGADNAIFDAKLSEICAAIAQECCAFLGVNGSVNTPPVKDEPQTPVKPQQPDDLFLVYEQAGAFGSAQEARAFAAGRPGKTIIQMEQG